MALLRKRGKGLLPLGDFLPGRGDGALIPPEGLLFLRAVSGEILTQLPEIRGAAGGSLPLGRKGRQIGPAGADALRQLPGLGQKFRLSGEDGLCLCPEPGSSSFLRRHRLLRRFCPRFVVSQSACQGFLFPGKVIQILPQRGQQKIKVVLPALQPQHLVLRLTALALGGLQLVAGSGKLPARSRLLFFCLLQLPVHPVSLGRQLLQLRRPAQNTG